MMKNKRLVGILLVSFIALILFYGCGEVVKEGKEGTTTTTTALTSTTASTSTTSTSFITTTTLTSTTITTIATTTTTTTTTTTLPKLPKPSFSQESGVYERYALSFTIDHPLSTARIYYTTDGSTPDPSDSESTRLYNRLIEEISIFSSATFSAIAVADGYENSDVARGEFFLRWWRSVGGGVNGPVHAMVVDDNGNLYVGGSFTLAGDVPVENIAMWDGENWHPLGNGVDGTVYSLAIAETYLYAGGAFRSSGTIDLNRIGRWNIDTGGWEGIINGFDDTVNAILVPGGVVAGGSFLRDGADSKNLRRIAYWNGGSWFQVRGGLNGDTVNALAYDGNQYYVGGGFFEVGNPPLEANNIASFTPVASGFVFLPAFSWSTLGNGTDDRVRALCYLDDGRLIVGGDFTSAGSIVANHVAVWNTTTSNWLPFGQLNRRVRALANDATGIYAGGDFDISGAGADEQEVNHIARFNYSTRQWDPLGTGLSGGVNAVTANNGYVYAGGFFDQAGGLPASNIAVWGIK